MGLLSWILAAPSAVAGLAWQAKSLKIEAAPREKLVHGEFVFVNTGESAVEIGSVRTSCSCAVAELTKRIYQPGESGSLRATLELIPESGMNKKQIYLFTDDPDEPQTTLELHVNSKPYLEIGVRSMIWQVGGKPETKTVQIKAAPEIGNIAVHSEPGPFQHELRSRSESGYELRVTPLELSAPARAVFTLQTDFPAELPLEYKIYANVTQITPPRASGWFSPRLVDGLFSPVGTVVLVGGGLIIALLFAVLIVRRAGGGSDKTPRKDV